MLFWVFWDSQKIIFGFSICSSFGRQLCQNCGWAGSELYVRSHITEPPCQFKLQNRKTKQANMSSINSLKTQECLHACRLTYPRNLDILQTVVRPFLCGTGLPKLSVGDKDRGPRLDLEAKVSSTKRLKGFETHIIKKLKLMIRILIK